MHQTDVGKFARRAIEHARRFRTRARKSRDDGAGGTSILRVRVIPACGIRLPVCCEKQIAVMDGKSARIGFRRFDHCRDGRRRERLLDVTLQHGIQGLRVEVDLRGALQLHAQALNISA